MAQTAGNAGGDFSIGRVINTTSAVFSRNFATFFAISLIAALPHLLFVTESTPVISLAFLVWIVLTFTSQAAVIYGTFQDMRGRRVSLGEAVSKGLERFPAILGASILMLFGYLAGLFALIVPMFILLAMWFVSIPACVVEKLGPVASLGRSRELTKGFRWRIFALVVLVWVVAGLIDQVVLSGFTEIGGPMVGALASLLWTAVAGAFSSVVVGVTYHELRVAREGIDIEQIASVFD